MTVKVDLETKQLEGILLAYSRNVRNIPPAVLAAGMVTAIDDLIQSEGNGQWPGFEPSTIKRNQYPRDGHLRGSGTLLQDTGQLAQIQTEESVDWVEVGSPAEATYARFHVTGTRNMEARDFLAIDLGFVVEEAADSVSQEVVR